MIGGEKCGTLPADAKINTWYKVDCSKPLTAETIRIEKSSGTLVVGQVEALIKKKPFGTLITALTE